MDVQRLLAHPRLRSLVASFSQRRASLPQLVASSALPARPDQFIEIYLAERYRVARDGGPPCLSPGVAVVGPQSRPGLVLHMSGEIDVFTIRFQPTGFHQLFGVAMTDLVDQGVELADVIGARACALHDAVLRAPDFASRVAAAQRWMGGQTPAATASTDLNAAARLLVRTGGAARIDAIAARSGLSLRQFERRFTDAVGLTPKFYARTIRLARALDSKARGPERGWAEIAHEAGFSDQSHLVRDCTALAGISPGRLLAANRATEIFNHLVPRQASMPVIDGRTT